MGHARCNRSLWSRRDHGDGIIPERVLPIDAVRGPSIMCSYIRRALQRAPLEPADYCFVGLCGNIREAWAGTGKSMADGSRKAMQGKRARLSADGADPRAQDWGLYRQSYERDSCGF